MKHTLHAFDTSTIIIKSSLQTFIYFLRTDSQIICLQVRLEVSNPNLSSEQFKMHSFPTDFSVNNFFYLKKTIKLNKIKFITGCMKIACPK